MRHRRAGRQAGRQAGGRGSDGLDSDPRMISSQRYRSHDVPSTAISHYPLSFRSLPLPQLTNLLLTLSFHKLFALYKIFELEGSFRFLFASLRFLALLFRFLCFRTFSPPHPPRTTPLYLKISLLLFTLSSVRSNCFRICGFYDSPMHACSFALARVSMYVLYGSFDPESLFLHMHITICGKGEYCGHWIEIAYGLYMHLPIRPFIR